MPLLTNSARIEKPVLGREPSGPDQPIPQRGRRDEKGRKVQRPTVLQKRAVPLGRALLPAGKANSNYIQSMLLMVWNTLTDQPRCQSQSAHLCPTPGR